VRTEYKPNCGDDLALVLYMVYNFMQLVKWVALCFSKIMFVKTKCPLGGLKDNCTL